MQSKTSKTLRRRRHDAQLKADVIAACREPGASVAAVALAHGLNANLVRKWLVGRGLKRCGLQNSPTAGVSPAAATPPAARATPGLQFVPVQLPPPASSAAQGTGACGGDETIEIELTRAGASLKVRWPSAQASACASWLGDLAAVLSR